MHSLIQTLERLDRPIDFFVRDDDAGWGDDALERLIDVFAQLALPIDLAAIPAALSEQSGKWLADLARQYPRIGIHQHGYAHSNHEPEGARKCEFGPSRPASRQFADVIAGRNRLAQLLDGVPIDPIFTPPWNRCSKELASGLHAYGFVLLSTDRVRDDSGPEIGQLPVQIDWERARREGRLAEAFSTAIQSAAGPIGIMLHHAMMDDESRAELRAMLTPITESPHARILPMRHWIGD
jgi:hypothetical protein